MRYFVQLSYFGKNFNGWQIQPNAPSVQELLNATFSVVFQEEVNVVGAGRTDTGVHARQMWAHFDVVKEIPEDAAKRLNRFLNRDVAIQRFVKMPDEAHARFDATARKYEYHISLQKDPFNQDLAWFFPRPLDVRIMQQACAPLFEYEDFSCFSKSRTQTKTNNCKITLAEWEQKEDLLVFHISANRFLRNMVRAITGTLVEIGMGKREVGDMCKIIDSKDRRLAGESAPAHGLFLTEISYPKDFFNGK